MSESETAIQGDEAQSVTTDVQHTAVEAETAAAQAAIEDAVRFANESIQAGDGGDGVAPIQRTELSREERAALNRKTARRQRELGIRELERQYPNTIVVPAAISIGDPNIASSAQRFLGLLDRTLYLLNRFGQRYMGAVEVAKVKEIIGGMIQEYVDEAQSTASLGRALVEKAKVGAANAGDQWFEPQYTTATLDISFGVKTRQTLSVVRALQQWDQAVVDFAALDFNGEGEVDQIDTLRQRERRLFAAISRVCLRAIFNVNQRNQRLAAASKAQDSGEAKEANGAAEQVAA